MRSLICFGPVLVGVGILAVFASACAQTRGLSPALPDSVLIGVKDTAAHLYRSAEGNGRREPARRVIREQRDLDDIWRTLYSPGPVPRIDFAQRDVLVAAHGTYGSFDPMINIATVLTRGAERIVIVRVTRINEECLSASELTHPSKKC